MNEDKTNEIVEKYTNIYKDKSEKFGKITILIPSFINEIMNDGIDDINQVRMSIGIFTSLIIDEYFEYIKELYDIDPLKYEEERLKYVRQQVRVTIIPETNEKIDEVKKLIGTSDRVGVIKSALEHYAYTKSVEEQLVSQEG